ANDHRLNPVQFSAANLALASAAIEHLLNPRAAIRPCELVCINMKIEVESWCWIAFANATKSPPRAGREDVGNAEWACGERFRGCVRRWPCCRHVGRSDSFESTLPVCIGARASARPLKR